MEDEERAPVPDVLHKGWTIKGEVVKNCAQTYAKAKLAAGSRQKSVFTWVPRTSILYTFPK